MTSALRMSLAPLFSALLFASPAAARRRPATTPPAPDSATECLRLASVDEVVRAGSLDLALSPDLELGVVRLLGTTTLPDEALWNLIGGAPPLPLSRDEA